MFADISTTDDDVLRRRSLLKRIGRVTAASAVLLGLVVLMAWGVGLDSLARADISHPAMVPSTALSVALLGLASVVCNRPDAWRKLSLGLCAGVVVICAVSTLRWLLDPMPGDRMSYATAVGLLLAAASVATPPRYNISGWITNVGLIIALIAFEGYLFDQRGLQDTPFFSGISFQTSVGLVLLFVSCLLSRPTFGWIATLTNDGLGSYTARRMLPCSVILPILFAWLALKATEKAWITPSAQVSTAVIVLAAVVTVALILSARLQNAQERADKQNVSFLLDVLNAIDTAVMIIDESRGRTLLNKSATELIGPDVDAKAWLLDTPFHALGTREVLAEDERPLARLMQRQEVSSMFVGLVDETRNEHALHITAARLDSGEPASAIWIIAIADETEGWVLRENLTRGERMEAIGQLAGGAAHEIANIMGVIRISADTGLLTDDSDAHRKLLTSIRDACERGADLNRRLLALTPKGGTLDGRADVAKVIHDALPLIRPSIPRQFKLDSDTPKDAGMVNCNPGDLEAALVNLILNARNALDESCAADGHITVTVKQQDANVAISVEDNGPGMSDDVLRHATEPFFTTRQSTGGSGLGLSMVRGFVERAGGQFDLRAEPGKGSVATMVLPRQKSVPEAAPEVEAVPDFTGLSILLVEDDQQFKTILSETLGFLGARLETATKASDALKLLRDAGPFDILLTDIRLGDGTDGYELAALALDVQGGLRVIYMSGYTDQLKRSDRRVPGLGMRKPVSIQMLARTIELTMRP